MRHGRSFPARLTVVRPRVAAVAGPLIVQAVPASVSFDAPAVGVVEVATSTPATTTYSGLSSAALAPLSSPATTNYSGGSNKLAENLQAIPASVAYSGVVSAALVPTTSVASTTFSSSVSVGVAVTAPPVGVSYSTPAITVQWIAKPNAANVNFDANADVAGLPIQVQVISATTTFSGQATPAETLQAVPATSTFNGGTLKAELAPRTSSATCAYSSGAGAATAITSSVATTTFDGTGALELAETLYTAVATVTFSVGNIIVDYDLGDLPGSMIIELVDNQIVVEFISNQPKVEFVHNKLTTEFLAQ